MKKTILFIFGISLFFQAFALKDSVGIKHNAGRSFILHKVEPKETLYSLSRRYHVSIDNILKHNPELKEGLKIATMLEIPLKNKMEKEEDNDNNLHLVEPSETLFSISRKYNVSVEDLKKWNKLKTSNISIGQKLIVNSKVDNNQRISTAEEKKAEGIKVLHTVKRGQTIFSIARKYNTDPGKIKSWNNLINNNINIGQELIVGYVNKSNAEEEKKPMGSGEIVKVEAEKTVKKEEKENEDIKSVENHNVKHEMLTVDASADSKKPVFKPDPEIKSYEIEDNEYDKNRLSLRERVKETKEVKKVFENGIAQVINGSEETKKYLALHKTAPIGTIMQVKNEMNNLSVFVKVIGRLPDTDENKNILIRITREAYDRLGAIDEKFRVELSFIP